jgi:hypothetical protein
MWSFFMLFCYIIYSQKLDKFYIGSTDETLGSRIDKHKNDQLWTWDRIKSVYRFRQQCVLKVKNTNWV